MKERGMKGFGKRYRGGKGEDKGAIMRVSGRKKYKMKKKGGPRKQMR